MENELDIGLNLNNKSWIIILVFFMALLLGLKLYDTFKAQELSNSEANCIQKEMLSILNSNPEYTITHYLTTQFFDINKITVGEILQMYNASQPYSRIFLNQAITHAYDKCMD